MWGDLAEIGRDRKHLGLRAALHGGDRRLEGGSLLRRLAPLLGRLLSLRLRLGDRRLELPLLEEGSEKRPSERAARPGRLGSRALSSTAASRVVAPCSASETFTAACDALDAAERSLSSTASRSERRVRSRALSVLCCWTSPRAASSCCLTAASAAERSAAVLSAAAFSSPMRRRSATAASSCALSSTWRAMSADVSMTLALRPRRLARSFSLVMVVAPASGGRQHGQSRPEAREPGVEKKNRICC